MKKQLKESLRFVWKYDKWWGGAKLAAALLFAILVPANTILLQRVFDDIADMMGKKSLSPMFFLDFGLMIAMMLLETILTRLDNSIEIKFDMHMTDNLEKDIIKKYKNIDYGCYENKSTYDIISRISQNPSGKIKSIYWKIIEIIKIVVTLLGLLMIYMQATALLIIVFLIFLLPMLYQNYRAGSLWYDLYEAQTEDERKISYYGKLLTDKRSLAELKIYGAVEYIKNLWEKQSDKMLSEKNTTLSRVRICLLLKSLFAALWYMSSAGLLLYCLMSGKISMGLFVALFNATLNVVDIITGLLEVFGDFSKEIKESSYISRFFGLKEAEAGNQIVQKPVRTIQFENVHFAYPGSKEEVLHGISFDLDLSRSTAIVGENGSGKTTMIKLLCGLYRPTKGRILFDGKDISKISTARIGKAIKVVYQDFYQYELTVRENVGFGNLQDMDNDKKINDALELAGFQSTDKMGLDKNLGKLSTDGVDLSKGQWQRLAVSRVFMDENAFAILDEPTASMDPSSESRMYQIFYSVMRSRGSMMISHRLASAKMADNILVLKQGSIIEEGTHEQLMKSQGEYCKLFRKQAQWYTPEEVN
ncbi:MAG: ABC transporter ATP-binding protein [Clostridia bacterium]|nr:ABC transporter ATP-binding protein [Clostridia bacterium]NCC43528.1 ABC transporter ATP-binding protein [Clostridia bacterium]